MLQKCLGAVHPGDIVDRPCGQLPGIDLLAGQRVRKTLGGDGNHERVDCSQRRSEVDVRNLNIRPRIVPGRQVQGRVSLEVAYRRLLATPDQVRDVVGGSSEPGVADLDLVSGDEVLDLAIGINDPVDRSWSARDARPPAGIQDVELVRLPADDDVLHLGRKFNCRVQEW